MPRPAKNINPRGRWRESATELRAILSDYGVSHPDQWLRGVPDSDPDSDPNKVVFASRVPALFQGNAVLDLEEEEIHLLNWLLRRLPPTSETRGHLAARLAAARQLDRETAEQSKLLDPAGCTAQIFVPDEGTMVTTPWISVHGRIHGLPLRHELFVASRIHSGSLLWPKEPALQIANGEGPFSDRVFEGGPHGPRTFSIIMVNAAGTQDIRDWLRSGSETGHYPGMTLNPNRMADLASVSFTWAPVPA